MSDSSRRPVLEALTSIDAQLGSLQQTVEALEQHNADVLTKLNEVMSEMKRWRTAPRPAGEGEEWLLVRRVSE